MSGLRFRTLVHIWNVSGISLSSCPWRAHLGMLQGRRPQEHSDSHLWLFLFPLAGLLGHWDCVWSPSRGAGDAHSWLAVAPRSFCPPTFALRCPMFCRYSFKDEYMFHQSTTSLPDSVTWLKEILTVLSCWCLLWNIRNDDKNAVVSAGL